jgi:hypothetical protein
MKHAWTKLVAIATLVAVVAHRESSLRTATGISGPFERE